VSPPEWSIVWGGANDETIAGLALDTDGNVFVLVEFDATVDFGTGDFTPTPNATNQVLVKLGPEGATAWVVHTAFENGSVRDLAVGPNGNPVLSGRYQGSELEGGLSLPTQNDDEVCFAVALAGGDGSVVAGFPALIEGQGDSCDGGGVAVSQSNDIGVAFSSNRDVVAAGLLVPHAFATGFGESDAGIVVLDDTGVAQWGVMYGAGGEQGAGVIASNPLGGWVVGGFHSDPSFTVADQTLTLDGVQDAYFAAYDDEGGGVWAQTHGFSTIGDNMRLGVDGQGNAAFAMRYDGAGGTIDFGGGNLPPVALLDIAVVVFDGVGGHVASTVFGGSANDFLHAFAVTVDGTILMGGDFRQQLDFDPLTPGALGPADEADAFLASVGGTLDLNWQLAWGPGGIQSTADVAVGCDGNVVAAGRVGDFIDLGAGVMTAAGQNDVFVVKLAQP